ncbi:MAG TPA: dihydrolipoyllysine-residue acetyltransferase [Steroidobacteraceae bacterium]|nr:dihydrolipoyllysine-residue acetyltransferase [Steroidobacteraceae bacterium]
MASLSEVRVPDLGDFKDVTVVEVMVREGESVEVDTPLITLETEKATMDVPSPLAGRISALKIQKGGKVSQGSLIALVEPASDTKSAAAPAPASASTVEETVRHPTLAARSAPAPEPPAAPTPTQPAVAAESASVVLADFSSVYAGPSVRKFARELGVDLARVKGSGPKDRITHEDVKAFVKKVMTEGAAAPGVAALPKVPEVDFARFGPVETRPLGRIQRISGRRLHASWLNVPHVTQFDSADITDLETVRAQLKGKAVKEGIKLTPLAFVLKACVKALQEFPLFNSSLDGSGENLVLKKYLHIGFAADTPNGLVVPVIRDADRKDIYELARELGELSEKAREGKLTPAQIQGGCFTISSLGGIGGTAFTPIINAPEVAILGVSRSSYQPVYRDGSFVPRLLLPLSLSYDHRVIDGALAARFTTFLARVLAEPRSLLEAIP